MASPAGQVGISLGGKLFFGGLTAGTFGLGCWQVRRYNQKVDQMAERMDELAMEASTDWGTKETPYRRKLLKGRLLHQKEVLIGPRGAPLAAHQKAGGIGISPQGYMVLTPLQLVDENVVWINRGWVPKSMVPGSDRGSRPSKVDLSELNNWDRPTETVAVTAIRSKAEKPQIVSIEHDYSKRPLQLFWMDALALQAIAGSEKETVLLTQVDEGKKEDSDKKRSVSYPLVSSLETLAEFKTTPIIHAGYAATWYGLSVAGVFMTRKLITRGRG